MRDHPILYIDENYNRLFDDDPFALSIGEKVEPLRKKYNELVSEKVSRIQVLVDEDGFFNPDYSPSFLQAKIFYQDSYQILLTLKCIDDSEILECIIAHEFGHLANNHRIKDIENERLYRNTDDEIEADLFALNHTNLDSMNKFLNGLIENGPKFSDSDPNKKKHIMEMNERIQALN